MWVLCRLPSCRRCGLSDPNKNRTVVRRVRRRKCRGWKISAVFPCHCVAFGICPHHDLIFLRNGKGSPVLSSGLCRAGLYAVFFTGAAACISAGRRVGRDSVGTAMCFCDCMHSKVPGGCKTICSLALSKDRTSFAFLDILKVISDKILFRIAFSVII